ncbi:MAG: hypothetical protein Q4A30_02550 [Candidatus Saccharibacteria bacterium]|nr:hypothetical protein [Candidatus Saccharibacteria bacterium]
MAKFGERRAKICLNNGDEAENIKTYHNYEVVREIYSLSRKTKVASYGDVRREIEDLTRKSESGEILDFSVSLKLDVRTKKPKWLEKTVVEARSKL